MFNQIPNEPKIIIIVFLHLGIRFRFLPALFSFRQQGET
jgi:hypothetical protein